MFTPDGRKVQWCEEVSGSNIGRKIGRMEAGLSPEESREKAKPLLHFLFDEALSKIARSSEGSGVPCELADYPEAFAPWRKRI